MNGLKIFTEVEIVKRLVTKLRVLSHKGVSLMAQNFSDTGTVTKTFRHYSSLQTFGVAISVTML